MILLAQAVVDPLLNKLFEQYGLPGLVIFVLLGIIWWLSRKVSTTDKRATDMEDRLMKNQERVETELRGQLQSKTDRIKFLEDISTKLMQTDTEARSEINKAVSALNEFKEKALAERQELTARVKELETQLSKVIILNDSLALDNASLITVNLGLKSEISERDKTIFNLQQTVNTLQGQVADMQEEIKLKNVQIDDLSTRMDKIDTKEIKDPTK